MAKRVKSGDLPPLDRRLPRDPLVVEPTRQLGAYGGAWNRVIPSPSTGLNDVIGYTALVRWDEQWEEIVPDVAESFEVNGDGTAYTFHLRPEMKWSDGEPFTADDVVFAMNDVMLDPDLAPAPSTRLIAGGEPGQVEKLDEYTVRFTFKVPNGQFLMSIASLRVPVVNNPKHYMKKFHKKYNPDVQQLVEEGGFGDWMQLYQNKGGDIFGIPSTYYQNPDMPTLNAWRMTTAVGDGTTAVAERNPFYWKVDTGGRQLPYIDKVQFTIVSDPEVMVVMAQNGEIDMQAEYFNTLANKPVLAQSSERGGYRLFDLTEASMNTMLIALNLNHKDLVKRKIFQNRDFRIGLSHAINRQEIIDTVFKGQGEPWQAAPRPESPLYDEEFAKEFTSYDVDTANQYLDSAGYSERDSNGIRLGPDGAAIRFNLEFNTSIPQHAGGVELIEDYWKAVGIDARAKPAGESLFQAHIDANELDAAVDGHGQGLLYDILLEPNPYFPFGSESLYAYVWGQWAIGFRDLGQEPPANAKRQIELYADGVLATNDIDEQVRLMKEILRIAKREFWQLGVMLPTTGHSYGVVNKAFRNTPRSMITAGDYHNPGPTYPEQYFSAS